MEDYRMEISLQQAEHIANYFLQNGYDVIYEDGCLVGNYLIHIGENNLKLGKVKLRKYIIILEKYLNEWCSTLEMILTDNERLFESFYDKFAEVN